MNSSRCICVCMVDYTFVHAVSNAIADSIGAGDTYHDVFSRERTRVGYAALDVCSARHLVAQAHCNVAEQRRVEEPVITLLRLVLVKEVVLLIVVMVSCQFERSFDILQGAHDIVVLP